MMPVRPESPPEGAVFPSGLGNRDESYTPTRGTSETPLAVEAEDLSNPKDAAGRRKWNVIVTKIPQAQRDIARVVLPDAAAVEARRFASIGPAADAPDDDTVFGVGTTAMYSLCLTDAEAARFRAASNAREVVLPRVMRRPTLPGDSFRLPDGI